MTANSLYEKFPTKVALAGTSLYTAENAKYWSATAILAPAAIFLPTCAQDVSEAIKLLIASNTPFAIRSGGHLPVRGAAGTDGGVLISTSALNDIMFTENDTLMRVGAGARWGEIYSAAEDKGRIVVGGRCPEVGVGLILGGGLSLISGTYGLACDSVTEFEVVLANGDIVVANESSHGDLFWALKGGNNNFGVVTYATLRTYPLITGWGGMVYYPATQAGRVKLAVEEFMKSGYKDPKAGVVPVWVAKTDKAPAMMLVLMFHIDPTPFPESLKPFTDIPSFKNTLNVGTLYTVIKEHSSPGSDGLRRAFISGSVVGAPETVATLTEAVFEPQSIKDFVKLPGITVAQALQPVTAPMLTAGSHVLSMDTTKAPFIWYCICAIWPESQDDALAFSALEDAHDLIKKRVEALGFDEQFVYMNEGGGMPTQPGYESFGMGTLKKLVTIRDKYDPDVKLRSLLAGVWKLPLSA